jgi:hypothetical protein
MMNDTVDPPILASPEQQAKLKVDLGPARVFFPDGTFEPPFREKNCPPPPPPSPFPLPPPLAPPSPFLVVTFSHRMDL